MLHRLIAVSPAGMLLAVLLWPVPVSGEANVYRLELHDDRCVEVTAADGATAVFAPRFVVLRSETDPKLQIRGGSPGGVDYNLTTWGKDERPPADPDLHVPDGSDPSLDRAFGADRTADLFRACPAAWIEAEAAVPIDTRTRGVRWQFQPTASFTFEAEVTLPTDETPPVLSFTFTPRQQGWYSIGYVGAPTATLEEADEIWQPLIWNEKRLPDQSYLTQAFRCPLPTALVTRSGVTTGVVADPGEFPFMPLPTFRQNNPFGVAVRTPGGEAQAMLFAPVLGGAGSRMSAGEPFRFAVRLAVVAGAADAAFEQLARTLYGFSDRRANGPASLNTTLDNMIEYGMSEWSRFDADLRGCGYSTDVPGAVKNVSSLHPLGVALVTDDPAVFTDRALPMIEYMLSREKFLFTTSPEIQIQNPSWLLGGPCCPLSELAALASISGGRSAPLLDLAKREYGRDRIFNLTATTRGDRWQNSLALYRATGDEHWRHRAIEQADAYLARRAGRPQADFDDPDAEGMFFWPSWVPQWVELYELYDTTRERRFLDAAVAAARDYAMFTWMCPAVPDGRVAVDQGGMAPRYREGDRYDDIPVTPGMVEAWRLSEMGLTPEGSGTCKGHRGILNAHHAPFMLRIAADADQPLLRDIARNALIGRYQNFPGYHINTDRSLVFAAADFPLRPQRQLNATTSIHYNHIWPHIALVIDYLVSDVYDRSGGQIDFPSEYAEGYAYLQSRIYGAAPGRFYGDHDAWLWMPRGLLQIEGTTELNWIAARGDHRLYLAFTNQTDRPQRSRVQIDPERVDLAGSRLARVWRDNEPAAGIALENGGFNLEVGPHGLTALAIDQAGIETVFQHRFAAEGKPWAVGHAAVDFGGLEAYALDFGLDNTSAYVFLKATDRVLREVSLHWRERGGSEWHTMIDPAYPFEFRIPLEPASEGIDFFVSATRVNGDQDRSETGHLRR
ncbi:MAG: hypothetical protein RLZZ440_883 [Planctomycetota bacterium]